MDIKDLEQILNILRQNDVNDFELEEGGTRLKLSRGSHQVVVSHAAPNQMSHIAVEPAIVGATPSALPLSTSAGAASSVVTQSDRLVKVESPLVGTFYRKPAPDADPFVQEGQAIKKGETLCIVEAMKLMNEIDAPCSGKIEKVLIGDGQVVEYGEVLFLINPEA